MEIDRNGLEVLDRDECLRLLGRATLARIGITAGALPAVLPVNFWLDGDRILVRTGEGSKLDAAARDAVVAVEVDEFDSMYHSGWSVMVTGRSHEVIDPDELSRLFHAPLPRWVPRGGGRVLAISTDMISGRRIASGQPRQKEGNHEDVDARTGIDLLQRDECLRLLAADEVGRLAVVAGKVPAIFPVNYRLDGEAIVFRSDPAT